MSSDWIETDWSSIATLEYGKGLRDCKSGSGAYSFIEPMVKLVIVNRFCSLTLE